MVSSNLLTIVVLGGFGVWAQDWARDRLDEIQASVDGVARVEVSIHKVEAKIVEISDQVAQRAMQTEVDELRKRIDEQGEIIRKLVACNKNRRRCGDL